MKIAAMPTLTVGLLSIRCGVCPDAARAKEMPVSSKPRAKVDRPETSLSLIMRNRREFRARGVTAADLVTLESIARAAPNGMARLSVASVGRMIGVSRQTALHHVERLEVLGLIVRVGAAMMVNAKSVLSWAVDAVKNRALSVKRLFLKRQSQLVSRRLTDGIKRGLKGVSPSETGLSGRDLELALCLAMGVEPMPAARSAENRAMR